MANIDDELGAIGKRIAAERKRHRLTQEELGERLGVTRQQVMRYETGENMPLTAVISVSKALGVSVLSLLPESIVGPTLPEAPTREPCPKLLAMEWVMGREWTKVEMPSGPCVVPIGATSPVLPIEAGKKR